METSKPIKRNQAIAAFSRDHHSGLLLVWKIREGLRKEIDPQRISNYVLYVFSNELLPHFKGEEELLFNKLNASHHLRIQAESDHENINKLAESLLINRTDSNLLLCFADFLEKHIRFEERQLFNFLQESISETELSQISIALNARQFQPESIWTDRFWENKK